VRDLVRGLPLHYFKPSLLSAPLSECSFFSQKLPFRGELAEDWAAPKIYYIVFDRKSSLLLLQSSPCSLSSATFPRGVLGFSTSFDKLFSFYYTVISFLLVGQALGFSFRIAPSVFFSAAMASVKIRQKFCELGL